ncbi:hypothetical protein WN944_014410 [Citrus x changshan-huyou]|uniref:Uncharacterized protein n=1 Tax=Citrus x changshan-huyou TaxID=2935761 RepID=A0AAP0QQ21_9ROSI
MLSPIYMGGRRKCVAFVVQPPTPCMAIWLGDGEKPPALPKLDIAKS